MMIKLKKTFSVLTLAFALLIGIGTSLQHPLYANSEIQKKQIEQTQKVAQTVFITRTGSKYHREGCRYLKRSAIPINRADAEKNYSPCKVCRP